MINRLSTSVTRLTRSLWTTLMGRFLVALGTVTVLATLTHLILITGGIRLSSDANFLLGLIIGILTFYVMRDWLTELF